MNKNKMLFEIKRKSVHLLSLMLIFIYYLVKQYFSHRTAILSLVAIFIALSFLEFIRIKLKKEIPLFKPLYRDWEKDKIPSSIYLILGVIIAFSAFEFEIAVAALLMMIFGDFSAALFGMGLGKHYIKSLHETSWEGIGIEFVVNLLVGLVLLNNFVVIIVMASIATFAESVLTSVDDNLSVPVLAGFAGQVTIMMLRILGLA